MVLVPLSFFGAYMSNAGFTVNVVRIIADCHMRATSPESAIRAWTPNLPTSVEGQFYIRGSCKVTRPMLLSHLKQFIPNLLDEIKVWEILGLDKNDESAAYQAYRPLLAKIAASLHLGTTAQMIMFMTIILDRALPKEAVALSYVVNPFLARNHYESVLSDLAKEVAKDLQSNKSLCVFLRNIYQELSEDEKEIDRILAKHKPLAKSPIASYNCDF